MFVGLMVWEARYVGAVEESRLLAMLPPSAAAKCHSLCLSRVRFYTALYFLIAQWVYHQDPCFLFVLWPAFDKAEVRLLSLAATLGFMNCCHCLHDPVRIIVLGVPFQVFVFV